MKALLVIDMLNDFIDEQGILSCGEYGLNIVPFITAKIAEFEKNNDNVFFICDNHKPNDSEFKHFPPHCLHNTWGAQIYPPLKPQNDNNIIFKTRYSAFFNTDLEKILSAYTELHFVGVCSNICILFSVEEAYNRDFKIVVYKDGIASFDKQAHLYSLEQMKTLMGVDIK